MSCGIDGSANFCATGALNYEQNVLHQYWQLCNLLQSEPLKAFFSAETFCQSKKSAVY